MADKIHGKRIRVVKRRDRFATADRDDVQAEPRVIKQVAPEDYDDHKVKKEETIAVSSEKPVAQSHHKHESGKRALRIAAVVGALVLSLLLATCVGCGLALWDLGKTPSDFVAVVFDKSDTDSNVADTGDTGLTFMDVDEDTGDTGLTFIDANEDTGEQTADSEATGEKSGENTETADENADSDQSNPELVATAEISGIQTIMRAGSDQPIAVATASAAASGNPNQNYPLPFTAVDESYFDDALFIGDSRLLGFGMWSGLPGTYYCATGFQLYNYKTTKVVQTGNGKVPIFDALPYNAFTKIYIKVGLNEMGWSEAKFEETYAQLIAELRAMEPRAIIYVHAILPVTANKSATDKSHNNPNILARNAALQQFAIQQQAYYIDVSSVVSDANGCLKPESTSDGIHMSSRYMGSWKQYLMEHAVVVE